MTKIWKTKDGKINYDTETNCFCWIGESAQIAMHKHNANRRKYGDMADKILIETMDRKLEVII